MTTRKRFFVGVEKAKVHWPEGAPDFVRYAVIYCRAEDVQILDWYATRGEADAAAAKLNDMTEPARPLRILRPARRRVG